MEVFEMAGRLTALVLSVLVFTTPAFAAMDSKKFLGEAAQGGKAEVQLSQLATEKAATPEVMQFAQHLIDDHSQLNRQVEELAAQKSIQLPAEVSSKQQAEYEKLSRLSGKNFDKEFMSYNLKDHKKDVSDFKKQAQQGTDSEIKQLAAKTLPTLEDHLRMAQSVSKDLK
jgi:putative membrane protein